MADRAMRAVEGATALPRAPTPGLHGIGAECRCGIRALSRPSWLPWWTGRYTEARLRGPFAGGIRPSKLLKFRQIPA